MTLDRDRPEILTPPEHPPACCTQQTITVPPAGRGQDPPKTRLPLAGLAALLHPAHRLRANLLHHQRPRHHHHRPRLVPPHGPDPAHALDRLPARRPQPAHPRPPGTPAKTTTPAAPPPGSRPRPAAGAASNPRQARRRPALTCQQPTPRRPQRQNLTPAKHATATPALAAPHPKPANTPVSGPKPRPRPLTPTRPRSVRPKCEHETGEV